MPIKKDIQIGTRFGMLTVVGDAEPKRESKGKLVSYLIVKCDCGKEKIMRKATAKRSYSCGCQRKEMALKAIKKHGMCDIPEYSSWKMCRARCLMPNATGYAYYGGRGIKICERWNDFRNFFEDMGRRPSPLHTLDRIDSNGDYCPENCRWSTRKEQASNTRQNRNITYNGITHNIAEWSKIKAMSYSVLSYRLKNWHSLGDVFEIPIHSKHGAKVS